MQQGQDWNAKTRVVYTDREVLRYSILYVRQHADGWYDEIRYDSHDRTRGTVQFLPHFHMKVRSAFKKDTEIAETEIRDIIETHLPEIEVVLRR